MPDFNVRLLDDPEYTGPIINNEIALFKQEIIILLSTDKGEIFANNFVGFDIEQYLWELNVSNTKLQNLIKSAIEQHCAYASMFEFEITVSFVQGELRDIAIIDIVILTEVETVQRTSMQFIFK